MKTNIQESFIKSFIIDVNEPKGLMLCICRPTLDKDDNQWFILTQNLQLNSWLIFSKKTHVFTLVSNNVPEFLNDEYLFSNPQAALKYWNEHGSAFVKNGQIDYQKIFKAASDLVWQSLDIANSRNIPINEISHLKIQVPEELK
ncbi:hypothetical protein [Candidatus Albibeggiatoa sp. nov. NOAA]|uniref:hypothetical protein n=1 Tax=Candidatus Albibeggiatoa sp. nov. NOAA TaxID=3162724 RepID=UPI0032FA9D29|nr:hypothetical protein [Thiotrichaceae bacterium]